MSQFDDILAKHGIQSQEQTEYDPFDAILKKHGIKGGKPEDPQDKGFFSNAADLAVGGAKSALTAARLSGDVATGSFDKNAPPLISRALQDQNKPKPKEMAAVEHAFAGPAKEYEQAGAWSDNPVDKLAAIGKTIWTVGEQAITNPKGTAYLTASQIANMAPSIVGMMGGAKTGALAGSLLGPAGTAAGAITGGLAGGFAGEWPMEAGSEFIGTIGKELQRRGLENNEQNVAALLVDKKFMDGALSDVRTKATTTSAVDAAFTLGAGRLATGPARAAEKAARAELGVGANAAQIASRAKEITKARTIPQKIGTGAKAVGLDVAGGGASEAAGQYAGYGAVDLADVGMEMLGELGGAGIEVPAAAWSYGKSAIKGTDQDADLPADDILTQPAPTAFDAPVAPKPTAAEQALADIKPITALDRVAALDTEGEVLLQRKNELAQPDYGPMFDAERAEVESKLAGLMEEREAITKTWPKLQRGANTQFSTEAGVKLDGYWALIEADDLQPSHDTNLRPNPIYPPDMQPRSRSDRAGYEMQVSTIAQKLDPDLLGESPLVAHGAPIAGEDGLVESGTGRTLAIKRVYEANGFKAGKYRESITAKADRYGFTPDQVAGMKKPILIRVRTTPVDRAEFARQANASTVAQMSPSEQARADSARIDSLDDLNPDEAGDFTSGSSRGFVRRFMASLPGTEQSGMIDATGQLSQSGYIRMRNAILAKAYGDSPVLLRMVESLDNNLRGISNALMRAAPAVAKSRQAIAEGSMFDADITPDLMAAVEELSRIKDAGRSVEDALAQSGMFGDQYSPETRELLQFLADNIRRPRKIADFLQEYFSVLEAAGHPAQTSLMGETRAPSKGELLTAARGVDDAETEPKLSRNQETGGQDRRQPGDEARDQGGAQGGEGEQSVLIDGRPYQYRKGDDHGDNFNPGGIENYIAADVLERADEYVRKYYAEKSDPVITEEERARALALLNPLIERAEAAKAGYDQKVIDIARRAGAIGQQLAPVKGLKRAVPKLVKEEKFDIDGMKDMLRSTIVVSSYSDAQRVMDEIEKEFDLLRAPKNRTGDTPLRSRGQDLAPEDRRKYGGYADVLVNVVLPGGVIAEIQINIPSMLAAKEAQGHKLYEAFRDAPEGSALAREINDAMQEFYTAAFEARASADSRQASADLRKAASSDGRSEAERGKPLGTNSPESERPNTLPSGNTTLSSPPNESKNLQPGGNFSGTFMGSPSKETVPQGGAKPYTGSKEGGQDVNAKSRESSTQGQVPDAVPPAGDERGTGRVRDDQGGGNLRRGGVDDAGRSPPREVGQTGAGGVRGQAGDGNVNEPGGRAGRDAGVPDGRLTPDEKLQEGLAEFGAVLRQYYAKVGGVRMLTPEESAKLMPALIKILEALYEKGTKAAKALIAQAQARLKKHDDEFVRTHWNKITPADYAAAAQQAIENIENRDQQGDLFTAAAKPPKQGGFDFNQPAKGPDDAEQGQETPEEVTPAKPPKKAPPAGRDIPPKTGRNFVFGDNDLTYEGSWAKKAEQNVEAVELLKKLEADGRQATREEQAVLAKFIGWGASEIANTLFGDKLDGAAQALLDYDEAIANLGDKPYLTNARYGEYRPAFSVLHYRNPDLNWYTVGNITREMLDKARPAPATRKWLELRDRLQAVMTDQEWAEASRSTQYAHYTSKPVVKAMWRGMERMGFKGGYVLEPGAGIGVFPGLMPQAMAHNSSYTGIEFDSITGGILKQLFPDERILVESFVDTQLPPNFFTVAAGNPPFGQTPILADPKYRKLGFALHDYFFAKTIDSVQPGGLVMFVSSRYTMDKLNDKARAWMSERADLVGAIRLPQTAFQKNAGTEVVTDVLFLRKKVPGETFEHGQAWVKSVPITINGTQYNINEYFAAHPEMVLGKHSDAGSMYGDKEYTVEPLSGDIEAQFDKAVDNLPQDILRVERGSAAEAAKVREIDFNPKAQKEGNYYVTDAGVLMQRENGVGVRVEKKSEKDIALLKDFVGLRDALKQAHYDQLNEGNWEKSLAALQKAYRAFVAKHGRINQFKEYKRTEKVTDDETGETYEDERSYKRFPLLSKLDDDPEYTRVMALEDVNDDSGEITESAFLRDRVLGKPAQAEIQTPHDALLSVLNDIGTVDIGMVADRLGVEDEEAIAALGASIYEDPSSGWVMADEYLSGNVKKKLAAAIEAAKNDRRFERNVQALRDAQPAPKTHADITVQLGMPWIPGSVYEQFLLEKAGVTAKITYNEAAGQWIVSATAGYGTPQATQDWGTSKRSADEILAAGLSGAPIRVTRTVGSGNDKRTEFDPDATEAANQKLAQMREAFSDWLWADAGRVDTLVPIYNDKFNAIVPRKFDGSHMTLPGASSAWQRKAFPHVRRGAWRIVQSGNTYLAHAVGSGKTAQMVISAMEQKRLGLIRKPMIVVPNHMLAQMASEWLDIYPAARLMVADEKNFHTDNRRRWVSRVATSDLDGVVITHSAFKLLDLDPEFKRKMIENELDYLRAALDEANADAEPGKKNFKVKQIEKKIERLEQKLAAAMSGAGKDKNVRFDELGVDFLYVDEAHEYRKLAFTTNRQVKGVDSNGSDKAFDLWMKTRWLEQRRPGRSLVMASGTPVTNTMAELFSVQKFMNVGALEDAGLDDFDSWSAQFGKESTDLEQTAAGGYEPVTRFNKFVNVGELVQMFREFADVLTSDHLAAMLGDKRPKVQGGSRKLMVAPKTDLYVSFLKQELQPRMVASRKWKPSKDQPNNPDPVINIITDGRLAAIDMRFMEPSLPSDPDSKLNRMIDELIRVYHETSSLEYTDKDGKPEPKKGAAQMVFSDLGFGAGVTERRGFNARAWFEKRLRDAGIPLSEVAFMSDHKKSSAKLKLFKDVNAGRVRILVGSSKNMGTGVNAQQRLIALHHLDAPWYPADLEQREGRIIRQGNKNKTVQVYAHAMKGTYDEQMWSILARKQFFIDQALSGDANLREIEDLSETSTLQQASAMLADDPRLMEAAGLKADLEKLERLFRAHEEARARMKQSYTLAGETIRSSTALLKDAEKFAAKVQDLAGEKFRAKVGNTTFEKRKEWGEAVFAAAKPLIAKVQEGAVRIGEISGFPVLFRGEIRRSDLAGVEYRFSISLGELPMDMYGGLAFSTEEDPVGMSMRATNLLATVARAPANLRQSIQDATDKQDSLAGRLDAPFQFSQAMADKRAELKALEASIAANSGAAMKWALRNTQTGETLVVAAESERAAKLSMIPWRLFSDAMLDRWEAVQIDPATGLPVVAPEPGAGGKLFGIEFLNQTTMLSRGGSGGGMSIRDLKAVVARISKAMTNLPEVRVLASPRDLDQTDPAQNRLFDFIERAGAMDDAEGATHNGEIYLFASGLANEERAEHVLATHEVTHYGLLGLLGKEGKRRVLQSIWARNARIRKQAHELGKRNKINYLDATEEILADMDAKELTALKGWRGLVLALRDWLGKHGFTNLARWLTAALNGTLSEQAQADLFAADIVKRAREFVRNGPPGGNLAGATALSQLRRLADDLPAQERWLNTEARARGFKDIEDLLARDYPLFEKLAALWRKKHPAEAMMSRAGTLRAPNGKPSNLSAAQWRQVRTPEFKKWFGDWENDPANASKVVDENGEPLVVYHGTIAHPDTDRVKNMGDIKVFDRLFTTQFRPHSIDTLGSWFSTNRGKEGAQMYANHSGFGGAVYPVFLSIKNLQETTFSLLQRRARLLANGKDDGRKLGQAEVDAYRKWLSDINKDGIKIVHDEYNERASTEFQNQDALIAIESTQIKSAIGNIGTFNHANPDISLSRSTQPDAAQRADAILADTTAKWRPLDAITKAGVKLVRFDRATQALYTKAGKLLDALTPEKVKAGVVADYGVPGAVLDQRAMMQGRKRVQLRKTEQLIDKLASLTRAESRVAYEWMNNDNTQAADYLEAQLPPESVAVLKDVREMIDKLSQEAVRLGQLDAETYKKHRYAYLRRSYAKHMEEMPGREKAKRQRAIAILGDQYKGRGMVLDVAMKSIQNVAPEWWQRKLQAGKADKGLKGEQFIRLERRAHTGEGTTPMAGIGDRSPGRLLEVAYWPAGEAIPTKLKDWERNGTWQVRDTQGDKLVLWRDFTKQERETMGEVDEARFAIARTLHGMIQDIETGRYLNWLADNHAVIDPSRVTGPVVEASERMRDAFAPEEWVKVPDTKIPGTNVMKYGKLAGRYLPGPIWNDVRQTVGFRFQPLGETYAALHSAWKTSKTALSPAVHMNNVMANFVMADWHDVGAGHILKSLRILLAASERDGKGIIGRTGNVASRAGIADREAAREILNRYQDSGGGIGTWITQEIQKEQMLPLIEALENELGLTGQNTANQIGVMAAVQKLMRLKFGEAWDAFKGSTPGGKVVQEARNLIGMYEAEDQVFRLAAWLKAKEDGINDLEAGKVARKSFLDYHINAPWVQMMRNTAFPFIAFTYRSVPMLLDVAANKPWKLMKLGLVLGALNAIGYALSGGDEDDERKLLPEEKSGSIWGIVPKLIRMPWNDEHGSPVFLDIRRFVPVGDIFDVGQPNTAVPVPPAVVPSGPLALLGELALNKSAFTGKPVTQETDTGTEMAGKVFDHLYKALAPNIAFLPGTHAWTSVTSAGGGKTDPFGREQSMAQAMASSVGFKLGSYPKDVLQYNAKRAAQAKVMEIDANINKLRREFARQGISEAEYQEKAQAQMEKKRRVMEELAEKAR